MTPLDAALDYAGRGWRVLPIKPGEKRPPMLAWQNHSTVNPHIIRNWFEREYPDHGVGIATGQLHSWSDEYGSVPEDCWLFVIDVDINDGKQGDETLADLEAEHGPLPDTYEVITGSGGRHLYFYSPVEIRSRPLGLHIDTRGEGGQALAPPTFHPTTGARYELEASSTDRPTWAPQWLIDQLTAEPEATQISTQRIPYIGPDRPGDIYAAHVTWAELLEHDGARRVVARAGYELWSRPGLPDNDRHTSASLGYGGTDLLKVFTSNWPGLTQDETYTRFGYYAATRHSGDHGAAARAIRSEHPEWFAASTAAEIELVELPDHDELPDDVTAGSHVLDIIDWDRFWNEERPGADWLVPNLVARGRGHALYAGAKTGKSFLTLYAVAEAVQGRCWLTGEKIDPIRVLYLDYEMTEEDLEDRLEGFGYGPDDDLSGLRYAVLPRLFPLDTSAGGQQILQAAKAENVDLVIVDTLARAVQGDENENDTYKDFYRHTGMLLKKHGIAVLRLDHAGKDSEKGMRGASSKADDVDVVIKDTRTDKGHTLKTTHRRMGWFPELTRVEEVKRRGAIAFRSGDASVGYAAGTEALAKFLERHGVPPETSRRNARKTYPQVIEAAGAAGCLTNNDVLGDALKYLRARAADGIQLAPRVVQKTAGPPPQTDPGPQDRTTPENPHETRPDHQLDHPGPPSEACLDHPAPLKEVRGACLTDLPDPF